MTQSLFNGLLAIAAIVAILDYFGVKPKGLREWQIMPLNRKLKLIVMLCLAGAALLMSGYSFYWSLRPKIVEKVVEKPVTIPCSSPVTPPNLIRHGRTPNASAQTSEKQSGKNNVQSGAITQGSGSIAQLGGRDNQATINNFAPPARMLTQEQISELSVLAATIPQSQTIGITEDNNREAVSYAKAIADSLKPALNPKDNTTELVPLSSTGSANVFVCIQDESQPSFPYASRIANILAKSDSGKVAFQACPKFLNGKQIMIYVIAQH